MVESWVAVATRSTDPGVDQARLYEDHRLSLQRFAFLLTGSTAVAEELVQDAFVQVVRRWEDVERPLAYVRIAILNGARGLGRARQRVLRLPPEPAMQLDEEAVAVRDALADLRREEREVLVLRYFLGLTDSQIAAETGRPIGTVKSQIHRGLMSLREVLT